MTRQPTDGPQVGVQVFQRSRRVLQRSYVHVFKCGLDKHWGRVFRCFWCSGVQALRCASVEGSSAGSFVWSSSALVFMCFGGQRGCRSSECPGVLFQRQ